MPERVLHRQSSQCVPKHAVPKVWAEGGRGAARRFIIVSAFIWLSFSLVIHSADAKQPNILLILTDDQGWSTLGSYGGKLVPTPHLDRLAATGARFTNAYVTSQCTPTRATILTGQYTARHGLWHVLSWYGYPWAAVSEPQFLEQYSRDTFTMAKGLRAAGYRTAICGKWHLTSNEDGSYNGLNPSASHFYGFDYAPPLLSRDEFKEGADRGVEKLTSQALQFIEANRDQPWFCFLSHHMIHGKVVAPEVLTEKYRRLGYGDEGPNRAVYLAGLECIDQSIGRIVRRLEELDEHHETMILFLSDNGGIHERLDFRGIKDRSTSDPHIAPDLVEYSNAPLRAGKGSVYEGGVRVPLILSWPGKIEPDTVVKTPVHAVDLLPTFLSLAQTQIPADHPTDGCSLIDVISAESRGAALERSIYQYYPFYDLRWGLTPCVSVRRGNYKLIEFFGDRVNAENQYISGPAVEMYDLSSDPGERHNLAQAEPRRVEILRQQLRGWMRELGVEIPTPNPHFDPARAFEETRERPEWLQGRSWTGSQSGRKSR